jgi:ppGpp synthetase/RelA/SpoT-type nucleotidyltranferase
MTKTEHQDKYTALALETNGSKAEAQVLQLLRDCKLSNLCYAYKIRTKTEDRLIHKVSLKRQEHGRERYALTDITDVVGLRLVALFKGDMVDLFDGVLSAITHSNTINPNPFLKDSLEEIIIYKGDLAFDETTPRLVEIVKKHVDGFEVKQKNSNEGYSSIHIVSRLNIKVDTIKKDFCIPIEIQIRTVFEDAWGEIDHKYGYVIRTGKDTGKPINNADSVLSHLKVLKKFTDGCMEYAESIRNEATGINAKAVAPRKVISVASDEYILTHLQNMHVSHEFIEDYINARNLKLSIEGSNNPNKFLDAAEAFREAGNSLNQYDKNEANAYGYELAYYYSRMNEAFCLMSTNDLAHVSAAKNIYHQLDEHYSHYPLLKMRLGQALGKLDLIDESIFQLTIANDLFKSSKIPNLDDDDSKWPDVLPKADYQHIAINLPKLLGYNLWLKIKSLGSGHDQEKFDLFHTAYEITLSSLSHTKDNPKSELSLQNNLLYYSIGALSRISMPGLTKLIKKEELEAKVHDHIGYLEAHAKIDEMSTSNVDTLMKAYWLLKRDSEATLCANNVIERCLDPEFTDLNSEEKLLLMRVAQKVIQGKELISID